MNDFNFDMDFDLGMKINNKKKETVVNKDSFYKINASCIKRLNKNIFRRAFSETQLLDAVGIDFKDGESYHCLTGGDVDGLSYLKVVLRQQNLDYCLFSTWCMAITFGMLESFNIGYE